MSINLISIELALSLVTAEKLEAMLKETGIRNRDLNVNRIDAECAVFNIVNCGGV